ncbi:PA14 domain-containing protein [Horticoccus sp. 23ND18S-11]|uniref:hypothetical protein n=1 Tax=Horticoccus sp. 23ND18S-11 TaxID=3391832 RepID=UPI0039C954B3
MLPAAVLLLTLGGAGVAAAATAEWKDTKGGTFRGEPVEALGPLAVFRTGGTTSKFLPMRALSPEDCVRFHAATAGRPPRAERWSEAQGEATRELVGRLLRTDNRQAGPVDLSALPEPELLIAVFVGPRTQGSWQVFDNLAPFVARVQRVFPGRVATVVVSSRTANGETRTLPVGRAWYVVDPKKQLDLKVLTRFGAGEEVVMILMTRDGVPLFGTAASTVVDVMKFVDGASDLLWHLNPANPRNAQDRAHYLRAVRPVQFAAGRSEPVLLTEPFRMEALRQRGVERVDATIDVAADGSVAQVALLPTSILPSPLVAPIGEALRRSGFFLPAIEQGNAVASRYDYALKIPPVDAQLAADGAWVKGEARVDVPIASWLVLKPVHVPEQVFSTVDRVGEDGTVMLKAVTAGSSNKVSTASQMNAFNTDWFTEAGAASVRPAAGDKQEIDGTKLVWKKVTPNNGLVDFLGNAGNLDFCVGYAWTEFEVPEDTDGWLGIGSDDGLKVWLNGELVNDKWQRRTSRLDDDVVPLRLKKGKNQFLIKIQNAMGLWSFTCRLRVRGK